MRAPTMPFARTAIRRGGVVCAFLTVVVLGGCTPWPAEGTGGLAERHPTASVDLVMLEHRYRDVLDRGAERQAASRAVDARLLLTKARREIAAKLADDADVTLSEANVVIAGIERDLERPRHTRQSPNREQDRWRP